MLHTKLYIILTTEQENIYLWIRLKTVPKFYQKHNEDSQSLVSLLSRN